MKNGMFSVLVSIASFFRFFLYCFKNWRHTYYEKIKISCSAVDSLGDDGLYGKK